MIFEKKNASLGGWLFIFIILFNSGFLYLTDNKQAGVPFVREFFLIFLVFYVCYLFFKYDGVFFNKYIFLIVFYVFFWMFLSSFLAFMVYGQPVFYGLFEERRLLHWLVFVPVFIMLAKEKINIEGLELLLVFSFILSSMVGFAYSFQIIQPRLSLDFQVGGTVYSDIEDLYEGFRSGRFRIGTLYLVFIYLLSLAKIRFYGGRLFSVWSALSVYIILYTWIVVQTRTVMAVLAIVTLLMFRKMITKQILVAVLLSTFFLALLVFFSEILFQEMDKFEMLLADVFEKSGPRTRDVTLSLIFDSLLNYPSGMGALSLQWLDGFRRIYNDNFYLSDVGFFGVLYRFGFFVIIFLFIYIWFFSKSIKYSLGKNLPLVIACKYSLVLSVFNFMYSNTLSFDGGLYGVVFAICIYLRTVERRAGFASA